MKLAFLLHIYQPSTQEEATVKKVATECYFPLIKLLKNKKSVGLTMNVPLSLLEWFDKLGYKSLISDIKDLYASGRVELVGSAAYHSLLTKLPEIFVEKQIILDEYALGYYFGSHQDFEGNQSLQMKNLAGFFPPEMAINTGVLKTVSEFDYKWIIADETAFFGIDADRSRVVFKVNDFTAKVICRERTLSNMISFKRDTSLADIESYVRSLSTRQSVAVVALDGEVFGHHNREGIYLLDVLVDKLVKMGVELVTVSDIADELRESDIPAIRESTWGASDEDMVADNPYPLWDDKSNELHRMLWELQDSVLATFPASTAAGDVEDGYATLPIWNEKALAEIRDDKLRNRLTQDVLLSKFLESDKFWWVSKKPTTAGDILYHPGMTKKALAIVARFVATQPDGTFTIAITPLIEKIQNALG